MRLTSVLTTLSFLALSAASTTSVNATVIIGNSNGGQVQHFLEVFSWIAQKHEPVVVTGNCISACTLIFRFIPEKDICVMPDVVLGFHSAYWGNARGKPNVDARGRIAVDTWGTQLLWDSYTRPMKDWIRKRGGLTPNIKFARGRELAKVARVCR